MPDWGDYQNKFGGRWIIERADPARMEDMDDYWLETLFILIGEVHVNLCSNSFVIFQESTSSLTTTSSTGPSFRAREASSDLPFG